MGLTLRRGFKTEAESYARDFRQELGLRPVAPLDMFRLADHLAIPAFALSAIKDEIHPVNYSTLTATKKSPLSALTFFRGRYRAIVFNDTHAPTRQQSDLAHELSHAILDHPPSGLTDESGGRHYNRVLEEEANCLAGALLVPRDAAISIVASGRSLEEASEQYNISVAMMRMRINQTGARKIMFRAGGA